MHTLDSSPQEKYDALCLLPSTFRILHHTRLYILLEVVLLSSWLSTALMCTAPARLHKKRETALRSLSILIVVISFQHFLPFAISLCTCRYARAQTLCSVLPPPIFCDTSLQVRPDTNRRVRILLVRLSSTLSIYCNASFFFFALSAIASSKCRLTVSIFSTAVSTFDFPPTFLREICWFPICTLSASLRVLFSSICKSWIS